MADPKEFTVSFPDEKIAKLRQRLADATFPDELDNVGWDYGAPLSDVKRLTEYWHKQFDFKKAEAYLNKYPQFTTPIQCDGFEEISIHYVYIKSEVAGAIPLLFSHGWPGNFMEGFKLVDSLLKNDSGPAFHIVIPSLPNYGFSQGIKKRGFSIEQYSETCHKLMIKLGYKQYVTQGGDWGWFITRTMSLLYPESCLATHFNFDVSDPPEWLVKARPGDDFPLPDNPTAREKLGKERSTWFKNEGFGYNLIQQTKPQTPGYGLADSPVALLSWIYEKLHDWTDKYPWTDDEICTWISIYYFSTAGPAASLRIYYESRHDKNGKLILPNSMGEGLEGGAPGTTKLTRKYMVKDHGTGVLIGQSHFPKDVSVQPSVWTRTVGNVVYEADYDSGGHFAAWEKPEEISSDLKKMFAKDAPAGKYWAERS